jgi:hypothetical protein
MCICPTHTKESRRSAWAIRCWDIKSSAPSNGANRLRLLDGARFVGQSRTAGGLSPGDSGSEGGIESHMLERPYNPSPGNPGIWKPLKMKTRRDYRLFDRKTLLAGGLAVP